MSPGMGLMKRRLEKEADAVALAVSGIAKRYDGVQPREIRTLETKYDDDGGDWYVALGWGDQRDKRAAIVKMDSVQAVITGIDEIAAP